METKENLTNEAISKRFDSQFDLVNYAIGVAQDMIHAGRGPRVKTQTENPALQVLAEINAGKDYDQEVIYKKEHKLNKVHGAKALSDASESFDDSEEEEEDSEEEAFDALVE